jgi:hypothetical protein
MGTLQQALALLDSLEPIATQEVAITDQLIACLVGGPSYDIGSIGWELRQRKLDPQQRQAIVVHLLGRLNSAPSVEATVLEVVIKLNPQGDQRHAAVREALRYLEESSTNYDWLYDFLDTELMDETSRRQVGNAILKQLAADSDSRLNEQTRTRLLQFGFDQAALTRVADELTIQRMDLTRQLRVDLLRDLAETLRQRTNAAEWQAVLPSWAEFNERIASKGRGSGRVRIIEVQ